MENILPTHLQEVMFSSSDPQISKQITKLVKNRKLKKIIGRIYTSNFSDPDEAVIRRNLFQILLYRHKILLGERKQMNPGAFKNKNNRIGDTHFVSHELVKGTLIKGFDYYNALQVPFARAAYMMFFISEVHPYLDGNGRMARVMMNAELTKTGQVKIIIPTVFREDYLGALRRLTREHDSSAYLKMLGRAQEFSATIVGEKMEKMEEHLTQGDAFKEPTEGELKIIEK